MSKQDRPNPTDGDRPLRAWTPPLIKDLPPLKDLTLQTGDPIGGGASVFP